MNVRKSTARANLQSFLTCAGSMLLMFLGVIQGIMWAGNLLILFQVIAFFVFGVGLIGMLGLVATEGRSLTQEKKIEIVASFRDIRKNKMSRFLTFLSRLCKVVLILTLAMYGWWPLMTLVAVIWLIEILLVSLMKALVDKLEEEIGEFEFLHRQNVVFY